MRVPISLLRRFVSYFRGPCCKIKVGGMYWLAWGDGRRDDTAVVQGAVTAAKAAGAIVFIPVGTFRVTRTVDL
jgi:hypothetical protein